VSTTERVTLIDTRFGVLAARFDEGRWRSIAFDDRAGVSDAERGEPSSPDRAAVDAAHVGTGGLARAEHELRRQLAAYEAGVLDAFDLPLQWDRLGAFQRAVLEVTAAIAYGETTTYGHIAATIGRAGEARAVGQALRTNPWAVVVPCHRVVAADGALTGYGGGPATGGRLDRKAELLAHERRRREPSLF